MALFTIIRVFVLAILFNLMLPTGDVYSDIALMIETIKFKNSDTYEMIGCRACYGKEEVEVKSVNNEYCTSCTREKFYNRCGGYPSVIDKLNVKYKGKCEQEKWGAYFNGSLVKGECDSRKMKCCFDLGVNSLNMSDYKECGVDACKIHLDYFGGRTNIKSVQDWKTKIDFYLDYRKVGGKNCELIQTYGYLILVPLTINLIFNIITYTKDFKNSKTTLLDIPIVLLCLYPQWRCLKILCRFIRNKDQDELEQELEENERNVSFLEPYLESAIQVQSSYLIFVVLFQSFYYFLR